MTLQASQPLLKAVKLTMSTCIGILILLQQRLAKRANKVMHGCVLLAKVLRFAIRMVFSLQLLQPASVTPAQKNVILVGGSLWPSYVKGHGATEHYMAYEAQEKGWCFSIIVMFERVQTQLVKCKQPAIGLSCKNCLSCEKKHLHRMPSPALQLHHPLWGKH